MPRMTPPAFALVAVTAALFLGFCLLPFFFSPGDITSAFPPIRTTIGLIFATAGVYVMNKGIYACKGEDLTFFE